MDKENEEIKTYNITKMETPETDEALTILHKFKYFYDIAIGISIILSIFFIILSVVCRTQNDAGLGFFFVLALICFIAFIIIVCVKKSELKPYYDLLELAMNNDKVRHEERIRFKERLRLEEEYKKNNETKIVPLNKNKLEKERDKEIGRLEVLKENNKIPPLPARKSINTKDK